MKSLKFIDRRVGNLLMAFAFLLAAVSPALIPSQVSAAQLMNRSIQLSSSAANADNQTYTIKFDAASGAAASQAFIVDFCSNSPLIGAECNAPVGFSTAGAATATNGYTVQALTANTLLVEKTVAFDDGDTVEVAVSSLDNPTTATTSSVGFYGRIVTYDTEDNADAYTSEAIGTGVIDDGGVAMSITNAIGVSAAVLETMLFCVAGGNAAITENCGDAASHPPTLELGEDTGGVKALSSSAVSTGTIYTQISTNASSGAVINMKSSATDCGGLLRSGGGSTCNIGPADAGGIAANQAEFGVKTATPYATSGAASAAGTLAPVTGSGYNSTNYFMDYVAGNATGVTSPYGDPFIDTAGAPANNQNMDIEFGASVTANTPAGLYTADINMIATGRF